MQRTKLDPTHLYDDILNQATPERRTCHQRYLRNEIGFDYPFSSVPYFLQGEVIDRLSATTEALLRLLMAPEYQKRVAATPWFLPQRPIGPDDCHGAMDIHLAGQGGKLIEVNFSPPGYLGFNRLAEEALYACFDLDSAGRVNDDFETRLVDAVCGGDRAIRLAIAVNHGTVSEYYRPHYRYVEKIFRRHGVDADMVFAAEVEFGEGELPRWGGKSYQRVFNLVIPRLMEYQPEAYPNYIRLYHEQPERILPNPFGWRLGTKAFLTVCHNIERDDFGLDAADRELIREAALESHLLADFARTDEVIERFGGLERLILKPLDNYDTRGVHLQPSRAILEQVFAEERDIYVAQAFQPHTTHPFIGADGAVKEHLVSLRFGFVAGKVCGIRATSFEHTARDCFITPVVRR